MEPLNIYIYIYNLTIALTLANMRDIELLLLTMSIVI